ncbi:MAG TPA: hypothetical protein VND24_05510 [Steroidobacteraceae bacterium]|nr:hypothetical protein [Steroidobacteraceae bacterium]
MALGAGVGMGHPAGAGHADTVAGHRPLEIGTARDFTAEDLGRHSNR